MIVSNKTYDIMKHFAIYVFPALSALCNVIGLALHWEYTTEVSTIISAFAVFLASCIGMSVSSYNKAKKEEYEGVSDDSGGD